jgi:hypothetical protein
MGDVVVLRDAVAQRFQDRSMDLWLAWVAACLWPTFFAWSAAFTAWDRWEAERLRVVAMPRFAA